MPIITEGDIIGCVASLLNEGSKPLGEELESKLIMTASNFLGKQLET
jgi:hypothetical protein